MRILHFAALSLLLLPFLAAAEPATIKHFEALARAEADRNSDVVHTFIEGEVVSVSEEATEGFRRVRLPNGSVGWLEEAALALSSPSAIQSHGPEVLASKTAAEPGPAAEAPKSYPEHAPTVVAQPEPQSKEQELRARIPLVFFDDLQALVDFTQDEPSVHRLAQSLAGRQTASTVVTYVSAGVTGVFLGLAAAVPECDRYGCKANMSMVLGGLATALLGSLVSYSIQPKPHEFHALAAEWNATIDEAVVPTSSASPTASPIQTE